MNEKQKLNELKEKWTSGDVTPTLSGLYVIIRESSSRPEVVINYGTNFYYDDVICYFFVPVPPEHFLIY